MEIRPATRADMPRVVALMRELASFEKMTGPDAAAETRMTADLGRRFDAFVAEDAAGLVAYAIVFETYSTFAGAPILYLEDLYVTPRARRGGLATRMMRTLAREAKRRGCARMSWAVLDWNADARAFYAKLGATETTWVTCDLRGAALEALAR